jgi:hypothetical protein
MKKNYFRFGLTMLALLLLGQNLKGQVQGGSQAGFYVDEQQRYYQRVDLPVYIRVSTTPEGAGVLLSGSKVAEKEVSVEPIFLDGHGKHTFRHSDGIDPRNTYEYVIFGDGLPPNSRSVFETPYQYTKNGTRFYGKDLKVSLFTQDQMSGVEDLFFKVGNQSFASYQNAIDLNNEGENQIHYYAIDRVGNKEKEKVETFVIDTTPPESIYNVVGITDAGVISLSTKIYLKITDNIVGTAKTFYRFDEQEWRNYRPESVLPLQDLKDGNHTLQFYSIDHLKNTEEIQSFSFYLDRTAPIMSADVLGDRFIVGDQVYFSGRTKLKLTAVDNKSGVKQTWYSIDNGEFQQYDQPFYLPSQSGLHIIRYFAEDNAGNEGVEGSSSARFDEYKHNVSAVYVDLTGPRLSFKYEGKTFQKGNLTFISAKTNIRLSATDSESGVQKITYKPVGEGAEIDYSSPFNITQSGKQELEIIGYDNVNNRNVIKTEFSVDADPPSLFYHFSTVPIEGDAYPSYSKIFLGAQDGQTDCQTIYYSINGEPKKAYQGTISGFKKNTSYTILIEVEDQLGNKSEQEIVFRTASF